MKRGIMLTLILVVVLLGVGMYVYNHDTTEFSFLDEEELGGDTLYINGQDVFRNSNYNKDFIEISILEDNRLIISATTSKDYEYYMVELLTNDGGGEKTLERDTGSLKDGRLNFNKKYPYNEGSFLIAVYYGNSQEEDGQLSVEYREELKTSLRFNEGRLLFSRTNIYINNLKYLAKRNKVKKRHLKLRGLSDDEELALSQLAKEIVGEEEDDYMKAFLVADWVANNLYYDYDSLKNQDIQITKAIDSLKEKRTICQGYANVTDVLMKSLGIPSRKTIGYALGGSGIKNERWEDVKPGKYNHVWNEVFVRDRWVIIDTTWNSNNSFELGKFNKEASSYSYFDMTYEALADKHKITKRY